MGWALIRVPSVASHVVAVMAELLEGLAGNSVSSEEASQAATIIARLRAPLPSDLARKRVVKAHPPVGKKAM